MASESFSIGAGGYSRMKVTPEQLTSKAGEVENLIKTLEKQYNELEKIVNKTSGYWIGDAGDLHRKKSKEGKENIQTIIKRWKEHPSDLLKMAGLYQETEQEVEEIANSLPADVIS